MDSLFQVALYPPSYDCAAMQGAWVDGQWKNGRDKEVGGLVWMG